MRHLRSLLAGIVAAPLVWLSLATGQHRSQATLSGWEAAGTFDTTQLIGPAAILVAAGVVLGLLGTLRWSPVGPIVAGVLFVVPTVFLFVNPFRTLDAIPGGENWRLLGQDLLPHLPVANGTLLVLGSLLLIAAFSAQRWRRGQAVAGEPAAPAGDEQALAGPDDLTAETGGAPGGPAPTGAPIEPAMADPADPADPADAADAAPTDRATAEAGASRDEASAPPPATGPAKSDP
jgi:hypothetical protein